MAQLGVAPQAAGIRIFGLEEVGMPESFRTDLAELLIFGMGHTTVDVVIPGNKALMPDGTQNGPFCHEITDLVFSADAVELHEQVHLDGPALFHGRRYIIPAADFPFQEVFGKLNVQINHCVLLFS